MPIILVGCKVEGGGQGHSIMLMYMLSYKNQNIERMFALCKYSAALFGE
jgi:N-acetylglutamate synthase-like GNAT family acetyltransferase